MSAVSTTACSARARPGLNRPTSPMSAVSTTPAGADVRRIDDGAPRPARARARIGRHRTQGTLRDGRHPRSSSSRWPGPPPTCWSPGPASWPDGRRRSVTGGKQRGASGRQTFGRDGRTPGPLRGGWNAGTRPSLRHKATPPPTWPAMPRGRAGRRGRPFTPLPIEHVRSDLERSRRPTDMRGPRVGASLRLRQDSSRRRFCVATPSCEAVALSRPPRGMGAR